MSITEELEGQRDEALAKIAEATDLAALDAVRVAYLGKKGSLTAVLRGLGALLARGLERCEHGELVDQHAGLEEDFHCVFQDLRHSAPSAGGVVAFCRHPECFED